MNGKKMNLSEDEIERRTRRILRHEDRQRAFWLLVGAIEYMLVYEVAKFLT